jgi:hypothetical protein
LSSAIMSELSPTLNLWPPGFCFGDESIIIAQQQTPLT